MTDLRHTIAPKSDQLNADDLIGLTRTVRVTKVSLCAEPDQPIAVNFEGDNGKPYKPCKSMRRVLVNVWGPDGNAFVGRSMTLYRDDGVKFGGLEVGGIRISHMSHIDKPVTMALTATRAQRRPYTVHPLKAPAATPSADEQKIIDGVQALIARIKGAESSEGFAAILAEPETQKRREWLGDNRQHPGRQQLSTGLEAAIAAAESHWATSTDKPGTEPETQTDSASTDDPRLAGLSPAGQAFLAEFLALDSSNDVLAQEANTAVQAQARKLPKDDQPLIAERIEAHKAALRVRQEG